MQIVLFLLNFFGIITLAMEFQEEDLPYVLLSLDAIETVLNEMDVKDQTPSYPVASRASYMLATSICLQRHFPDCPEYAKASLESFGVSQSFGYSLKIYKLLQKMLDYSVFLTGLFVWPDDMYDKLNTINGRLTPNSVLTVEEMIVNESPLLKIARKVDDDVPLLRQEMNRMRNVVSILVLHFLIYTVEDHFCPDIMDEILRLNLVMTTSPFTITEDVDDVQTVFETLREISYAFNHDAYLYLRETVSQQRYSSISVNEEIVELGERLKNLLN